MGGLAAFISGFKSSDPKTIKVLDQKGRLIEIPKHLTNKKRPLKSDEELTNWINKS